MVTGISQEQVYVETRVRCECPRQTGPGRALRRVSRDVRVDPVSEVGVSFLSQESLLDGPRTGDHEDWGSDRV